MTIKYEEIVPWGRSFEEYLDMFDLDKEDLSKRILGCGDGPASFNSIMKKQKGKRVVSVDPIYQFAAQEISKRIDQTYQNVMDQTWENQDKFIWTKMKNMDNLGKVRMEAMREFLADYEDGKREERYLFAQLPNLPFEEKEFDLALSSHFLFLYSDNLSFDFHIEAINEMLRVAKAVRIFPLLDVNSKRSPYVDRVMAEYSKMNYDVAEVKVDYEFQKGGNTMLKIVSKNFG